MTLTNPIARLLVVLLCGGFFNVAGSAAGEVNKAARANDTFVEVSADIPRLEELRRDAVSHRWRVDCVGWPSNTPFLRIDLGPRPTASDINYFIDVDDVDEVRMLYPGMAQEPCVAGEHPGILRQPTGRTKLTIEHFQQTVKQFDRDGDGRISLSEWMLPWQSAPPTEDFDPKEQFRDVDLNHDGFVVADELFRFAVQHRHPWHVTG